MVENFDTTRKRDEPLSGGDSSPTRSMGTWFKSVQFTPLEPPKPMSADQL